MTSSRALSFFFFFNDTATTEIYTLSLHDALPISSVGTFRQIQRRHDARLQERGNSHGARRLNDDFHALPDQPRGRDDRSEEHTSELQSQSNLVCRLLLEKKKKSQHINITSHSHRN